MPTSRAGTGEAMRAVIAAGLVLGLLGCGSPENDAARRLIEAEVGPEAELRNVRPAIDNSDPERPQAVCGEVRTDGEFVRFIADLDRQRVLLDQPASLTGSLDETPGFAADVLAGINEDGFETLFIIRCGAE